MVDILAPVSGVITDQHVTDAAGVQALGRPNLFTISDLSHVWIVCDVYENDLPSVRMGDTADIHLNAYPNRVFKGLGQQYRGFPGSRLSGPPRCASKCKTRASCASACL